MKNIKNDEAGAEMQLLKSSYRPSPTATSPCF